MGKEDKIIAEYSKLYTSAVSDVLLQYNIKGTMDPGIKPLFDNIKMCGRAYTIKATPVKRDTITVDEEAKENCKPGEVIIIDASDNMNQTFWGDNSTTAVRMRGAVGSVIDGGCRDVNDIKKIEFPTYCRYIGPGTSKNEVQITGYNIPITCGRIKVNPKDIILGDEDGVVVIPNEKEKEILEKTKIYAKADKEVAEALEKGQTVKQAYRIRKDMMERIFS
jgi:4-hydroxy-4-methyl-2-oxoglutarate aldolase|tara:strand:+ start:397 stop:1059 length:663 start_codon:yes stop_codon:yes gene_type:complete